MWLIALTGLAGRGNSTSGRFTITIGNKQATGAKKILLQNATYLQHIAANAASEAELRL